MRRSTHSPRLAALALVATCLFAPTPTATAAAENHSPAPLADRVTSQGLGHRVTIPARADALGDHPAAAGWARFQAAYGLDSTTADRAFFDLRTAKPAILELSIPWVPGAGNELRAGELRGFDGSYDGTLAFLEARARELIDAHGDLFGIDSSELVLDRRASQGIGPLPQADGSTRYRLWHLAFDWAPHGLAVEGARATFRINHGNLIHVGLKDIGSALDVPRVEPTVLGKAATRAALDAHVGGLRPSDLILTDGELTLIAAAPDTTAESGAPSYRGVVGRGVEYKLVRRYQLERPGELDIWEGLVDSLTGEVVSFQGTAIDSVVSGFVRPPGNLSGQVLRNFPHADYLQSPISFADENGFFTSALPNQSLLSGRHVEMRDECGGINVTSPPGNLSFGHAPAFSTDCNSLAGPTDGNTAATRTAYYWTNEAFEVANDFMAIDWSANPLLVETNLPHPNLCLGYYLEASHTIRFTPNSTRCNNAGENVSHVLHEAGHALDFTDGTHPGTDGGSGEGYADIVSILRIQDSCIARDAAFSDGCGFLQNYTCTSCDGFRDTDWRQHVEMLPHTPETNLACTNGTSSWEGPCGRQPHCETAPATEAIWDLVQELIAAGDPSATAFAKVEQWFYESRPTGGSMFTCANATGSREGGAIAGSLYHTLRAVDDCDGDPSNGTPHAEAIFAALGLHEIAVGTASDPANQNNDCSATIDVTEPTASSQWPIGQVVPIRWTSDGVTGNVKIELSRNNGGSFVTLFASTPDDGVASWPVTGPPTDGAVIRVSSVAAPAVAGDSETFTIFVLRFVVTSTGDGGDTDLKDDSCVAAGGGCTLRAALEQSNVSVGRQRIDFALTGGNTFAPQSALPTIVDPVVINGLTQLPELQVEIDGSAAGTGVNGLTVNAGPSEISGLVINRFDQAGIRVNAPGGNSIYMNRIGTNQAGDTALGNGRAGIQVTNSPNNRIGDFRPGGGNLLSANRWGLRLSGSGSTGNVVFGNYIGTAMWGVGALGNTLHGIQITGGASRNTISDGVPRRVFIRDATANRIAHNGGDGIAVVSGTKNDIYAVRLHDNAGLGIDLANDGVTPNDPDDLDTGPNELQNFPVITNVVVGTHDTTVSGTLDLPPLFDPRFEVDLYWGPTCDPSGHGEGYQYLKTGNTPVIQPNGNWSLTVQTILSPGDQVTATATRDGSTSELSACFTVPTPPTQPPAAEQ